MGVFELVGSGTGIAGAILLALKIRYSPWAWPLWVLSCFAWILFGLSTQAYPLVAQNAVFIGINILGTWTWLIKPWILRAAQEN